MKKLLILLSLPLLACANGGVGTALLLGSAATVEPWYLSGGVSAANCIAAYQPKGAASLAASYDNLAGASYDAAPGVAPTFDAETGWTFNGSTQYLDTGVDPVNDQTWSMIVRYSGATTVNYVAICGTRIGGGTAFAIEPNSPDGVYYASGGFVAKATGVAAGNLAIAGTKAYRNGVDEGLTLGVSAGDWASVLIGCFRDTGGAPAQFCAASVQAIAIYDVTLTADQVAAITAAMGDL
jgi:hypothetical protein